jgi:chemotaxis family two-component system response regulator Rcp1
MKAIAETKKNRVVLLVEDNPGDARLAREAFRDIDEFIHLHLASDGMEAMAYLKREGVNRNAPRPDLILLDLNVPKMDGREVLARIKGDDSLKMIPTIVLSSSETDTDVLISYQLHANCYLRKPAKWDAFDELVRCVINFWLTEAKLPPRVPAG